MYPGWWTTRAWYHLGTHLLLYIRVHTTPSYRTLLYTTRQGGVNAHQEQEEYLGQGSQASLEEEGFLGQGSQASLEVGGFLGQGSQASLGVGGVSGQRNPELF